MKNRDELISLLTELHNDKIKECMAIYTTELINSGKMTTYDIQQIITGDNLSNANDSILVWLYSALSSSFELPPLSHFFMQEEIYEANAFVITKNQCSFPIRFKILARLRENSFLICQTLQEMMALKQGGIIRWKENMQRESVITKIGDSFISHIAYDDDRAREIGKSMSEGDFYPNALRWHIVSTDCDFKVLGNEIIVNSGYVAEIDGQHRDKGSEYALSDNPNIDLVMPIIITIGSPAVAQHIINQDEKRAPIDQDVVMSYKNSPGNNIVDLLITNSKLDECYKICSTEQALAAGNGFILKSDFGKYIDQYFFNNKKVSKIRIEETTEHLAKVMNHIADNEEIREQFIEFRQLKKTSWLVDKAAIQVFVYIASALQDVDSMVSVLKTIISKIDFNKSSNKHFNINYVDKIIKEVKHNV